MHRRTETGNDQDAQRNLAVAESLPTAGLPAQQLLLCSQGQGRRPVPETSHPNCGGRMANLWVSPDHRTAQQARLDGQPQARKPNNASNGHPEGQKCAKKAYHQQPQHPFPRYPNLVQDLVINYPDQVWASDITYIRLGRGFVYLAVIIDLFTRSIRGWHLSRSLDQKLTLVALQKALRENSPHIHHSDQGLQYAASEYVDMLKKANVKISMAKVGEPTQNGYAERLIRTIKEEEVYLSEYEDFQDCYQNIDRFLSDVYMHKRIHSSLGYLTPVEFEYNWNRQNMPVEIK